MGRIRSASEHEKRKEARKEYLLERKRRNHMRKEARHNKAVEQTRNRPTYGAFRDSNSPTGWSQVCEYQSFDCHGTTYCEYPCNGDC